MLPDNKQREKNKATYYKKNLSEIQELYHSAVYIEESPLSESMVEGFVLAPALLLYVSWILKSAKQDGISRLYFLARDGYPVYITAKKICEAYQMDIDCRYLYCSRYSLRVPMYSENQEEMLEYVCRSGIDVTLRKIFKRAGLDDKQLDSLRFADIYKEKLDKVLSHSEIKNMKQQLENDDVFIRLVNENSQKQWPLLEQYFRQEGLLNNDNVGIVDSGWVGSTQKSICDICKRAGKEGRIVGYYWGLYDIPKEMDEREYHGFYFEKKKGLLKKVFFSNCLFEAVFSATHGTTLGYCYKDDRVEPILHADNNLNADVIRAFNEMLEKYVEKFTIEFDKEIILKLDILKGLKYISRSINSFMWRPTKEEAEKYGSMLFSDDLLDDGCKELAPVFSIKEIKESHLLNKVWHVFVTKKRIRESAWYEGSVTRSVKNVLRHNCSYLSYKVLRYLKSSI